jgi:hypothetical protein
METIWLLIALALTPDKQIPQDLTGEITVSYHQTLDKCRNEAIRSDQRFENNLKARGMKKNYDEIVEKSGLVNMGICWNGTEARIALIKNRFDSPWLAVVARFTPIAYVDKNVGERSKVGTGIARVGRFKSLPYCREGLTEASTVLARVIKPQEEQAVFCLRTD